IRGKVTYHQVSFTYPGAAKPALEDISFTINPGEKLAVIGSTGSGKTSLFQLLPRLYDVNKGKILVDDNAITAYSFD
ncbi:ATP-binding cassette domain-containing protein, partial [Staphylococcus sp. SIMBA_130]